MRRSIVLAGALLLLIVAAPAAGAAPAQDDFTTACMARSGSSQSACSCQAGLAKASFSTSEQRVAVAAMRDGNSLRNSLTQMGAKKAKVFVQKMQALSTRARQQCF